MNNIVTDYKFPQKIYFEKILKRISSHIESNTGAHSKIIDYGCGKNLLKSFVHKLNPTRKVYGYDRNPSLPTISDPFSPIYDVWVFNHVLMYMSADEIVEVFNKIKSLNEQAIIIIGVSRQNILSKVGAFFLSPGAHGGTTTSVATQHKIINQELHVRLRESVYGMTDLFFCEILNARNQRQFL
jgi:hypothetical protein